MTAETPQTESPQPEAKLNRAARRALKHKRGVANPVWGSGRVVDNTPLMVAHNCRPYEAHETTVAHVVTMDAFGRLCTGAGTEDDYDRVGLALNIAKYRALEIDEGLANDIEAAQDAMHACKARYLRLGRFGFSGPELTAMQLAMSHQEVIINASSPQQMRHAYKQSLAAQARLRQSQRT